MRALPLLSLLLGSCMAVPALAANSSPEASEWLGRLARAEQEQSYQGSFVYERNGSFSSHDIWHRVQDGQVSERLLQLDGAAQEIVRVDGKVQCVSGSLVSGVGTPPDSAPRVLDPLKLMSWYDLAVAGRSRVAGRDAVIVTLSPRDQHRYAFELHLDRRSGLPLRSLMLNDKGQLLERFQMTHLDTDDQPSDDDLRASAACKPIERIAATSSEAAAGWRSDWLPPGFELINSSVRRDPARNSTVSSLMYDDGLARFSVFLEPVKDDAGTDTRAQLGPTVAVSRHLNTPKGKVMVTVVGEIPLGTAERVALSMRAQDAQASQ
ncbi:MucB/RseB C-terminal domain-containing protein [Pseudomonas guariconensis]|uniref:MucB/RseB C-terminal domain-containing protein n=1 Tax=Pseudomonas TaxID=286 RepID=UPI0020981544|nr:MULTISPECIES: MucB/RseB C-terminal domain-containing protein [Pseudomonas]MCO7643692.1 MucB/RseB C-terminal domain-containing protein [Pseudomonas sp. S 311-6]MCO7518019.1 MucB/RseB C-terminal domain-containing protein [Pseudomonas putida]MCO7568250.1 MucB/RseB C-terminal domain-containing protein [Pseudomonas mosselii]MCO7608523.1 MucB/RseB C-terminal domain-containing protein [Pseudomonas guariconensis]MCO7619936.1 MucB/RseB C-terminal domain-containing protein [Pseudomonas guariconensis]